MTDRCKASTCGRPLKTEKSKALGYGPVCWRRINGAPQPRQRAPTPSFIDVPLPGFDNLERTDTTMQFLALTETNDHEGETWRYWLQRDGNETALEHLRAAIDAANEEETYDLDAIEDAIPESDVDALVEHTLCGYTTYENKVAGVLTLPDDFDVDLLYKGGVGSLFKAAS